MRLTRYKAAIDEAYLILPKTMARSNSAGVTSSPLIQHIKEIFDTARLDEKLFLSELVELYNFTEKARKELE